MPAALTDRQSGRQLRTARHEKAPGDVLALQVEIAAMLVEALPVAVSHAERRRLSTPHTRSPQAFETFMRGQAAFLVRTAEDNARARELFREAISIDPQFARACAAIATTHTEDYRLWRDKDREASLAEARRMADAAFLVNPGAGPIHFAHAGTACHFQGDAENALVNLNEARARSPADVSTRAWLAVSLLAAGKRNDALREVDEIRAMRPALSGSAWLERMPIAHEGQRRRLGDALKELGL